jgi:hypothetical protein
MLGKVVLEFPQPELVRVVRLSAGLDTFKPRSWMALVRLLFAVLGSRLAGKANRGSEQYQPINSSMA